MIIVTLLQVWTTEDSFVMLTVPAGSQDGIVINDQVFVNLGWQSIPDSSPAMVSTFYTPTVTGKVIASHVFGSIYWQYTYL